MFFSFCQNTDKGLKTILRRKVRFYEKDKQYFDGSTFGSVMPDGMWWK